MVKLILLSALSVGGLGLLFGALLAFAARMLHVARDVRIEEVEKALAGVNCGVCGYAGCAAYARSIVEKGENITLCTPGGHASVDRIKQILNITGDHVLESMVAKVRCSGDKGTVARTVEYKGVSTCAAVSQTGGDKACVYGCLGYADCVRACPFGAILMGEDGLPRVIEEKCTGCALCVRACPRNIIELVPRSAYFFIKCVSPDFGPAVSRVCKKGCIGCSLCARANNNEGIVMKNNLPVVDYKAFKGDRTGADKCPTKVIEFLEDKYLKLPRQQG